ncbi:MAG: prepilin-type N-terminal cleavage/methylation domain-containing protein [Opitutaceae bacterium]|nr:prepilin-type N-terminal cleavage/methylation domain-containing protein [Verrucomicrobiales bacterium]
MKTSIKTKLLKGVRRTGFTLVEVMIASAVMGTVMVSIYGGLTAGFALTQSARENLRATQIMIEKFETIRLYTWDQVNTAGFIPTSFTNFYSEVQGGANGGLAYTGTVTIADSGLTSSYAGDMKRVSIQVRWNPGNFQRTRQISTFVSRSGLQNYVY